MSNYSIVSASRKNILFFFLFAYVSDLSLDKILEKRELF